MRIDEIIAEVERLNAEATPGPWHTHGEHVHALYQNKDKRPQHHMVANTVDVVDPKWGNEGSTEGNASAIAAFRSLAPALAAWAKEAREVLIEQQQESHGVTCSCGLCGRLAKLLGEVQSG